MKNYSQSYISKELMHFVGSSEPKGKEQYNLLIEILKSGILTPVPKYPETSGLIEIHIDKKLSDNEVYKADKVCFCDIPISDIKIHMGKYSEFGVSFLKSDLITKGASPIFYIEKNSNIKLPSLFQGTKSNLSHADYFNEIHDDFRQLMAYVEQLIKNHSIMKDRDKKIKDLRKVRHFFECHIFSFLKHFDSNLDDDDKENYYMEREWLILGNLEFKLADVYRIILPESYAKRFRKDMPNYSGQITFAE